MGAEACSQGAALAHQDASRPAAEQASLEEQYASRAVEFLRRAEAAGYFAKADQINVLKTNPDFTPLRGFRILKRHCGQLSCPSSTWLPHSGQSILCQGSCSDFTWQAPFAVPPLGRPG